MKIRYILLLICTFFPFVVSASAKSEPVHAIAMHGSPQLPADFKHFPYVNPNAPKGGKIVYGVKGTFDSVNPFILKSMRTNARGSWDHQFGKLVFESLMFRSRDEPFTMYGLLAEKAEWPEDRRWIEFTLNPKAAWSDGTPVTVEDVLFTYELLTEKGRPPYSSRTKKIERIEKTGPRTVRFTFNDEADREFPMIIALSPVLPKHAIDPDTFDQSTLAPMIGSGPYIMDKVNPGKSIVYRRNPDYWAKDLPSRIGFSNFDEVKIEYFRDSNTLFEAFRKGLIDVFPENDPSAWLRNFSFPAVQDGRIIKDEFETGTPAKMLGFVFNTRREKFQNRDVRTALNTLFDFEWTNRNLFFNAYKRTVSFWHGSNLSSFGIPASPDELVLLRPYVDRIKPSVLDGTYAPPATDGSGRDRSVMRTAFNLLKQAGFKRRGSQLLDQLGQPFAFEILVRSFRQQKLAVAYKRSLAKLGIGVTIRLVDEAQYQRRVQNYDYDMVIQTYTASLSPGIEQIWRWDSRSANVPGTFNFAGANDPAIDEMITHLLQARTREDFVTAVRAYDRLLISGDYVVPLFHINKQWVARWNYINRPSETALYGYRFETWWDGRVQKQDTQTQ
ncbi:MAG: extracellular solute-binding protein [Pseudomonadota bacterium]